MAWRWRKQRHLKAYQRWHGSQLHSIEGNRTSKYGHFPRATSNNVLLATPLYLRAASRSASPQTAAAAWHDRAVTLRHYISRYIALLRSSIARKAARARARRAINAARRSKTRRAVRANASFAHQHGDAGRISSMNVIASDGVAARGISAWQRAALLAARHGAPARKISKTAKRAPSLRSRRRARAACAMRAQHARGMALSAATPRFAAA